MCLVRILKFAKTIKPSIENLRNAVKSSLKAVGEGKLPHEFTDFSGANQSQPEGRRPAFENMYEK